MVRFTSYTGDSVLICQVCRCKRERAHAHWHHNATMGSHFNRCVLNHHFRQRCTKIYSLNQRYSRVCSVGALVRTAQEATASNHCERKR